MGKLDRKVAIVTGAGRGIGNAIAVKLASEGARVVVNDLDEGPAKETVAAIETAGGQAVTCVGSVTEPGFAERFVQTAVGTYDGLDIIVNNAGYTWDSVIQKTSDEQWDAIVDLHLKAPFQILRAAQPVISRLFKAEAAEGRRVQRKVVNISSSAGTDGNPGQANYSSAKAGIIGLTKTLAKEWGRYQVNVNAVAFGWILTRLTQAAVGPALYLREGGALPGAAASFGGDDLFVSEYAESEFLERISSSQREFLTRTAVLERMSGPLCEAVLDQPGSAATLADLARSNMLLVPLDHRGQWYRYHHLFRDMLMAELERQEPGLIPVLRRRAATWYLRNGLPEASLEYFIAAEDVDATAGLVEQLWLPAYRQGRGVTVQRWLRWLEDRAGIEGHPMLVVAAAVIFVNTGQPAEAERWADVIDRWHEKNPNRPEDPAAQAWAAGVRAWFCRHGPEQMRADADEAAQKAAKAGIAFPGAVMAQGIARVLCGDVEGGDMFLAAAVSARNADTAYETLVHSLCERALLAMARGDWSLAGMLAEQAHDASAQADAEDALVCAVRARVALHRGDLPAAEQQLVRAQRLRPLLTSALPYFAVQARIELARVRLALADVAGARTLMREIDELLNRRPDLGTLVVETQALRARLSTERASRPGASALTAAELRLLPLLATHMSVPEIAAELFVAPSTIKSQLKSVYRKLGASSRSQAVNRSRELGLLEG